MNRLRDKLAANSNHPVLATFVASFLEKQEKEVRKLSKTRNKTYTNILPASRNGVGLKALQPVFEKALNEALWEACAADIDEDYTQGNIKRYLQTYAKTAA